MTAKLYRVDISATAYVMAGTEAEAEQVIESAIDVKDDGIPMACSASANRGDAADPDWADALPYGGDESERTVAEIIAAYVPDQQDMERVGQMRLGETA